MTTAKQAMIRNVLVVTAMLALAGTALAEGWKANWQDASQQPSNTVRQDEGVHYDNAVKQVDWQQQVLKRPAGSERQTGYQQPVRSVYERDPFANAPARQASTSAGRPRARLVSEEPEVIPPGTPLAPQAESGPILSEEPSFNPMGTSGGCKNCNRHGGISGGEMVTGEFGGDCDTCGDCDSCEPCGPCEETCDYGWELFDGRCGPWLRGLSVFGGVNGFKNALDHGNGGNFGFNEGVNLARPLGDPWGCGYQIGANFVQSDFSGASTRILDRYDIHSPYRKQYFATAGIFRRAECHHGFQWGVAYDYMHDIHYQNADLQQIRSETGFVLNEEYEIGYYGAYGVGSDTDRVLDGKLDSMDMFVVYIRRNFEHGGQGKIWGGATGNGDGRSSGAPHK